MRAKQKMQPKEIRQMKSSVELMGSDTIKKMKAKRHYCSIEQTSLETTKEKQVIEPECLHSQRNVNKQKNRIWQVARKLRGKMEGCQPGSLHSQERATNKQRSVRPTGPTTSKRKAKWLSMASRSWADILRESICKISRPHTPQSRL